jgi:cytochrome-b5 reductase
MEKIKTVEPVNYDIIGIESITHDTKAFRFKLNDNEALDFLPGDHLMMHAEIDGQVHKRPYTPSSTPDDSGFFEIIIKRYPEGLMSRNVHAKGVGDQVTLQGPTPGGHFEEGMAKRIGMVAGGAGVTPMIAIIRTAIRRGWDVDMVLLFANKTVDDIILLDEFEKLAKKHGNFRVEFIVDTAPEDWRGHIGHIDESFLAEHLPKPSDDTMVFLCGPPMMEFKLRQKMLSLGHEKKSLIIP